MSKESPEQYRIRNNLNSRTDVRVFRNNIGMYTNPRGQKVKYGLQNPGGSDLIGWKSIIITADMVGQRIAQFTAIETKAENRKPSRKQWNFLNKVKADGGLSGPAWSLADALKIIDNRPEKI
jgi:hypothetical protein